MSPLKVDRRTFLETASTVTAATLLTGRFAWAADEHKLDQIGLELYTVRGEMKKDFHGTLAQVAAIGYKQVEFAGYFKHTPQQVRDALDKNGLTSPACHVDWKVLGDNWPAQIESAKVIGQSYIICPWIPEKIRKQPGGWKLAVDTFNRCGEASQKAGITFGYHNHWLEFVPEKDGKLPFDFLLDHCAPNLVQFEMDLCWITVGGGDPLAYFDRYPGRFPLVHVKDIKKLPQVTSGGPQNFGDELKDMTEVGSGLIDWKRIFAQSDKAGIKYYIVEHDKPRHPFDSIKTSYEYLRKLSW